MLQRFLASLLVVVAWVICGNQGAVAQEAVAQEEAAVDRSGRSLEEVIVTARKRDETSHDVPLSISAFSSQDLVNIGAKNLEDISGRTPGLQYASQGGQQAGRWQTAIRFRGMDINSTSPTQQLATAFIDGVPVMGGVSGIGVEDVERLEVIKGPQSAFFGRSTFGGAINFVTKDPRDEFAGQISAEAADMGQYDVSVSHEGPILPGKLSYRITGRTYHRDGPFRSQVDQGKMGEESTESIAATVLLKPTESFSAKARIMMYEDEDGEPAGGLIGAPLLNCWADNGGPLFTPPPGYTGVGPVDYFCGELPMVSRSNLNRSTTVQSVRGQQLLFQRTGSAVWANPGIAALFDDTPSLDHNGMRRKSFRASLNMSYTLPGLGWQLTSMSGYDDEQFRNVYDYDAEAPLSVFSTSAATFEDFFQEIRLSSAAEQRLTWLLGLSYFRQEYVNAGIAWFPPPFDLFLVTPTLSRKKVETPAVFASTSYKFTDQVSLSLEGRYQVDKLDQGALANGTQLKKDFPNFMPRVILQYQPIDETNLYLTYAQGNKPGDFNAGVFVLTADELRQIQEQVGGGPFVDEEELENFEIGWKQRLLENRVSFELAAYYMKWKNQQTRVPTVLYNPTHPNANPVTGTRPLEIIVAAGKTDLWGVELAANALVGNYGRIGATFNWAASDYKEFYCGFPQRFTGSNDCAGHSSPRFPEYSGSAFASYARPISDEWQGFVRGEVIYFGKAMVDESNLAWTKAYTTAQLRLGAETDQLRVEIWAKNLFDKEYYVAGSRQTDFTNGFDFNQQGVTVTPDVGRQIGLTAIYKF